LVTDFANYAMPLIRYGNGDTVTIERGRCACGRCLPRATVHGRSIDMLRRRDGSIMRATFFEELMSPEQVSRFLVHQRTYDRLDVHLVPTSLFSEDYRDHLVAQIREQTQMSEIHIILADEIDVKIAGKHRLLRSDVSAQIVRH
jgi:phenylacetate-CoA ligase